MKARTHKIISADVRTCGSYLFTLFLLVCVNCMVWRFHCDITTHIKTFDHALHLYYFFWKLLI